MSAPAAPAQGKGAFSPVVMAAVLIVGLIAFVAFFAGQAFDTGPRAELDTNPHAASKSAVGFAAAVDLLRKTGRPTLVSRGPLSAGSAERSVLVITLDNGLSGSLFEHPVVKRHSGPMLVVLPKWETANHVDRIGWVRKSGLLRVPVDAWLQPPKDETAEDEKSKTGGKSYEEAMRKVIEARRQANAPPDPTKITIDRDHAETGHALYAVLPNEPAAPLLQTGPIDRLQYFRYSPGWKPVVVDAAGRALMIESEDQNTYVLAEPDLMNTHGISDIRTASAMIAVLDQTFGRDASYVFDVSMHGLQRSRSFLRQAFEPPFLAATLCAIATALLMGWHAFVRFGRARQEGRAFALGKRALADNQADLIKMTGREHRMGEPYATVVRDVTARAVGAPRDVSTQELDALMDRLGEGGRTSWTLSTLRDDLAKAKTPAELEHAAARLHHWKLEMTRERQ